MKKIKIVGIIPAHLDSIRFPKKIIKKIYDTPMIEHVRRRTKLAKNLKEVYVATNSKIISDIVIQNGGKVIKTKKFHRNGTSRCAEAVNKINCTHVVIIQGDEPLILPRQIDKMTKIKCRVMRISFTGEHSYEINVQANFGKSVWEKCMEAGKEFNITPYGTETMHLLRAEKGFIIVGQDTDATMTPIDLQMDWID